MNRLNICLAKSFSGMVHDTIPFYVNTIPFCAHGLRTWCNIVPEDKAEFIHVGQVRENTARPFLLPNTNLPAIVDIEGDHAADTFRDDLAGCVRVCCGAPLKWSGRTAFARPTMSRFLVYAARNDFRAFPAAHSHSLGFVGKSDSRKVRERMVKASIGLPGARLLQDQWHGPTPLNHPVRASYEHAMLASSIALCPMGEGVATARFYEACFYGRFPVIVGESLQLGDGYADLGFSEQISEALSHDEMRARLVSLADMPLADARDRGRAARAYFDAVVREYFADPTLAFIKWLRNR